MTEGRKHSCALKKKMKEDQVLKLYEFSKQFVGQSQLQRNIKILQDLKDALPLVIFYFRRCVKSSSIGFAPSQIGRKSRT